MRTHTIRNKSKPTPIVTFTKPFLAKLLASHPLATRLTLARMLKLLRTYSGKQHAIDHEQRQQLEAMTYKLIEGDLWYIDSIFKEGFMNQPLTEIEDDLTIANNFYNMLDNRQNKP